MDRQERGGVGADREEDAGPEVELAGPAADDVPADSQHGVQQHEEADGLVVDVAAPLERDRVEQGDEARPPRARALVHQAHERERHREGRLGRLRLQPARQLPLVPRAVHAAEVQQRVEQGRALAEHQREAPRRRQRDVVGHLHQLPLVEAEVRLGIDAVVDRARGGVVEQVVGETDVEHDHVRRVRQTLPLELEQLLIGAVPLDAQVDHLQPRVERLHHRRERLRVAHAVAEGDRVAEHDDAAAAGGPRLRHLAPAVAEPVDRGFAPRERVAERGPRRPAVHGRVRMQVGEVVQRDALQVARVRAAREPFRARQHEAEGDQ